MSNLSEYEKARLDNIKANEELLRTFELPSLGSKNRRTLKKTSVTNKRSHTTMKVDRKPTRISARIRGKSPEKDMQIEQEQGQEQGQEQEEKQDQRKLLDMMKNTLVPNIEPVFNTDNIVENKNLSNQLKEMRIHHSWSTVKVTPYRINGCTFHPSNTKLLGCAVDMEGHLGFWDIEGEEENGDPVVYSHRPHKRTITDVKFDLFDTTKLLTSSYDGNIKIFDMKNAEFEILNMGTDYYPITSFDIKDRNTIWFSTSKGEIGYIDKRSGEAPTMYAAGAKKMGCIDINPIHENLLAAASNDKFATVWDIRNMDKQEPLKSFEHGYAVTSCYWSPKGDVLATTCYDDYVRLFQLTDQKDFQLKSVIPHNNHTGAWVTNFRARWNMNKYHGLEHQHFIIGNMNRTTDIFSGESGKEMVQLYDEDHITTIQSVVQFHPNTFKPNILAGNASGRMVCWTI